jgi:nucleotide-binding universal stress UspA family protein
MSFRDILVVVDTAPAARGRVELAAALAERFQAHLIGLHNTLSAPPPPHRGYLDRRLLGPVYREFDERMQAQSEAARKLFDRVTARPALSTEWRNAGGYPSDAAALHGRYVDLIVLGQTDPDDPEAPLFRPLPEEVALGVGRPVLVMPYAGDVKEIGRRVPVGWDASRAATRAINDAMPLLAGAASVTVLSIDPETGSATHGDVPGADIALHLARHGVTATVESMVSGGIGIGNALLSRAADLGADLLVMGCYGHSRLRELVLGGASRSVLQSMTLPVLMGH